MPTIFFRIPIQCLEPALPGRGHTRLAGSPLGARLLEHEQQVNAGDDLHMPLGKGAPEGGW